MGTSDPPNDTYVTRDELRAVLDLISLITDTLDRNGYLTSHFIIGYNLTALKLKVDERIRDINAAASEPVPQTPDSL